MSTDSQSASITGELPEITIKSDTRDVLAHASRQAERYKDTFIVDIDGHVTETAFWNEITEFIDDEVLRYNAQSFRQKMGSPPGLMNHTVGMYYQDVFGRIPHQAGLLEDVEADGKHKVVHLVTRAIDSMGIHTQVVFPTPMLLLGMHPQIEVEVALGNAFNRWLSETILPQSDRIKGLMYLPFNDPAACVETVKRFAGRPGVIGFTVTSTRNRPVWHNDYMPLYRELEERGMPLVFHAGYYWNDPSVLQLNRFMSMHAITFVHYNLIHLTNWIVNGLPERFPKLNTVWVESGLAWLPFIMQRLDAEYMMRPSEAPLLKKLPSDYIREMYYACQPMETSNMDLLEATFKAIKADTQLLFSSDWPHWDFDLPSAITKLPFIDDKAKRQILGLNAARLFKLDVPPQYKQF